jgi:hypothetical protein
MYALEMYKLGCVTLESLSSLPVAFWGRDWHQALVIQPGLVQPLFSS